MFDFGDPDIVIQNAKWKSGDALRSGDLRIHNGKIAEIGDKITPDRKAIPIDVKNTFMYPGLINAHDHLEMNLYPRLGTPFYSNYVTWANDIYRPHESPIREIEKVHIEDRLLWGGFKNLISGVTTVIHHNPWNRIFSHIKFPVKVLKKMTWAHSLKLGKNIEREFESGSTIPFAIHAAEGIDELAGSEVAMLHQKKLLQKNTVLIHGVGASLADIELIRQTGAALVWCPASNLFMFNRTAIIDKMKGEIPIALGTDSTLTGSPTLLAEMQAAAQTGLAKKSEIYRMVSSHAESIFRLNPTTIQVNSTADLFCMPIQLDDYLENLFTSSVSDISLVLVNGAPKLIGDLENPFKNLKSMVSIQGKDKIVGMDVRALKHRVEKTVAVNFLEKNPLWQMID